MNNNTNRQSPSAGGLKAMQYVMDCALKIGPKKLADTVRSKNTCKACAFGTGGQRGGLHNEYSNRVEICNKNIQAHLSDIRDPIPTAIFQDNSLEELRELSAKQLEDLGRIKTPLYKAKGADRYQPLGYEEAIAKIVSRLKATQATRSFFYGSGRSSNEAAFILQLFARLYGCNHINNCSYYCHQASGVGLGASIGTGTATIQYADLHKSDCIFVFGANPASNHPRFVKVLLECRQRGGKVIVVNPAKEAGLVRFASPSNFRSMISGGSDVASHYIQVHIGGDIAFMTAVAKYLIEHQGIDQAYIDAHCEDAQPYLDYVSAANWDDLLQQSGVELSEIADVAETYKQASNAVFAWGMGLTHHRHGTENIESIANLAMLRGMIGGEGRGLLPLRGHSNVQGVGSMGFTPALKSALFESIEAEYKVSLPTYTGMDTLACVEAAAKGEIDFTLLLGGNLYAANPDSQFAARALSNIPFKVMINSTLNQSHINGVDGENIILPIKVRDEEDQPTTQESMFNYVRMSDGGFDRLPALWSEVQIISQIAAGVINKDSVDFSQFAKHRNIRKAIAKIVPGFEALAEIDSSKEEFHIPGRHLKKPKFPTESGRARFRVPSNPTQQKTIGKPSTKNTAEFMLTSVRSEGQFNTIIYNEEDVYRRQKHRNVVYMNPADIALQGLKAGDRISLTNTTGTLKNLEVCTYDIRQGNLMTYFPEANILVPLDVDQRSRTPAFKSIRVFLETKS